MHRIAVLPGDGIGKEVVPEGLRVLEAAATRFDIPLHFDHFDFASCDYYARHGVMMPADWKDRIGGHDAIFFGAVPYLNMLMTLELDMLMLSMMVLLRTSPAL